MNDRRPWFTLMTNGRWSLVGLLVALLAAFPLVETSQYVLSVMVTSMILLMLNTSWNFVLGVAGVWNFGQLAIYAIGGYGAGIIMLHTPLPPVLALVIGGLFGAAVSILVAIPTLRLFGIYTSLLTFSFAEVIQYAIMNDGSGLTGGSFGFSAVNGLYSSLSPSASMNAYYWTILLIVVATTVGVSLITRSRVGITLRAIRDAPAFAAARGASPLRYRLLAFAISGFIGGIAGALYLCFNQSISPSVMGLSAMSLDVTMLVIGGLGTMMGPFIGTTIVVIVQTMLVNHPGVELTVVGLFLLVIVVFVPGGLVGLAGPLRLRVSKWVDEGDKHSDGDATEPELTTPST
jgi:branched-chain amino acid transport system permease protein